MIRTLSVMMMTMLIISCGSKKVLTKYYTLEPAPPANEPMPDKVSLPYSVYIQKMDAAKPFNDNTIVLRSATNEIQYYVYHKWADKPGNALRRFIWQYLSDRKIFSTCEMTLYQTAPDLEIAGYLYGLERVLQDDEEQAHLKITLQLKKSDNMEVLAEHRIDRLLPMGDPADMNRFAEVISTALQQELDRFIEKIQTHFK